MPRAPFNALIFPYRFIKHSIEYAIFNRSDSEEDFWQGLSGGGEDSETPIETAIRETWEESRIPKDSQFIQLDSIFSVPVTAFGDSHLWRKDKYVIPEYCFGVFVEGQNIVLSHEHTEFKWLTFEKAIELLRFESNRIALWELDQRLKDLAR
jgi:dATP pyrophosphohydrolase